MSPSNPYDARFSAADKLTPQAETLLQRNDSRLNYVIFFTPRSGSTWLADLLQSTGVAGKPREWFNPQHMQGNIKRFGAVTPNTYAALLRRAHQTKGVFGLEITYNQYRRLLSHLDIFAAFPQSPIIYLRRMNLILQAISLYRAIESQLFHVKDKAAPAVNVQYDGEKITHYFNRILAQEWQLEQLFKSKNLNPLRITYESLAENPESVAAEILFFVNGDNSPELCDLKSGHQKVGSSQSLEWAERFRTENEEFVRHWNFFRGRRKPR